ncbi:putative glutathione S-transferase [Capsicum annuum]|nr:putative glutathione S-transferase [Capsicum annuum]
MATGSVKLLGVWVSPFVILVENNPQDKVYWSEFIQETMLNKSELLLKSNPVYKKVPVMFHDEKPICESLVILLYIEEAWPNGPSILPFDPYDRAIARFWSDNIDEKVKAFFISDLMTVEFLTAKLKIKSIQSELIYETMLNKSELLLKSNAAYKKVQSCYTMKSLFVSPLSSFSTSMKFDRMVHLCVLESSIKSEENSCSGFRCCWRLTRNAQGKEAKAVLVEKMSDENVVLEEVIIKISKGKLFFSGERIGYLYIVLGSLVGWLKANEMMDEMNMLDETKMRSPTEWYERFCSDKVVKDIIPQPEKLVEICRKFHQMKKATSN